MAKTPETKKTKPKAAPEKNISAKDTSAKNTSAKSAASEESARKVVARQRGLGRGLSSLLGDAAVPVPVSSDQSAGTPDQSAAAPPAAQLSGLADIPIEWINSGPWQPRRRFDIAALEELADSIRSKGLVQPVLVRPHAMRKNRYELIAGERRWRAAQMAQLHNVPAIVRDFSDEEAYEVALIENVQRADLNAIEEAEGYRQLIENFGYKQSQLSEIIGKSRSHIANLMRLLGLPDDVRTLVTDGSLTMGQVRPLIGHEDASALARDIMKRGLNARQAEALASRPRGDASGTSSGNSSAASKSADIRAIESKLETQLGIKTDIIWNEQRQNGRMTLTFSGLEQLEHVLEKLGST